MDKTEDNSITGRNRITTTVNGSKNIVGDGNKVMERVINNFPAEDPFKSYCEQIHNFLLHENLRGSLPSDEIRRIVRERTLAILRTLDNTCKVQVIRFLHDLNLIDVENPIIDLSGACLDHVVIQNLDLSKVSLSGVIFKRAELIDVDLSDANLSNAVFEKAQIHAQMKRVNLHSAKLPAADLEGTDLDRANLISAKLVRAYLHNVNLSGANLSHAILSSIDISGAYYTRSTIWPGSFDPQSHGAVLVDDDGEPVSPPS